MTEVEFQTKGYYLKSLKGQHSLHRKAEFISKMNILLQTGPPGIQDKLFAKLPTLGLRMGSEPSFL